MNLKDWLETDEHQFDCAAANEGQWCCLNYLPDELAERIEVSFASGPRFSPEGERLKPVLKLEWKS